MLKRLLPLVLFLGTLSSPASAGICDDWNALYARIRDFQLPAAAAKAAFAPLHRQLLATYGQPGIGGPERVYPVEGYDTSWGEGGRAFKPKGYDFFTGNPQGIHPSLDLFILDRDQDILDDRTGAPVPIVAFSGGVVVGRNTVWDYPDTQRGGKYLWIFDPTTERYTYYAHLSRIDVQLGQIVRAGDPLGLLGRTGRNAWKQRSPTHLHLMVLDYQQNTMRPYSPWQELLAARNGRRHEVTASHGKRAGKS